MSGYGKSNKSRPFADYGSSSKSKSLSDRYEKSMELLAPVTMPPKEGDLNEEKRDSTKDEIINEKNLKENTVKKEGILYKYLLYIT